MTKEEIRAKVQEMIDAPSCCKELKEMGNAYLEAFGTENEAEAQKALIQEMKEDVTSIEDLIGFAGSARAAQVMGKETAQGLLAAAKAAKDAGEDTCICAACQAAKVLLKEWAE